MDALQSRGIRGWRSRGGGREEWRVPFEGSEGLEASMAHGGCKLKVVKAWKKLLICEYGDNLRMYKCSKSIGQLCTYGARSAF